VDGLPVNQLKERFSPEDVEKMLEFYEINFFGAIMQVQDAAQFCADVVTDIKVAHLLFQQKKMRLFGISVGLIFLPVLFRLFQHVYEWMTDKKLTPQLV
jgi:hypothetical protein